jgi:hypothetical protein
MKTLRVLFFLLATLDARADFAGYYAVTPPTNGVYQYVDNGIIPFGNWVADIGAGICNIDTASAPQILRLNVDDALVSSGFSFQTSAAASGTISFTYEITGTYLGHLDWFYFDTNNVRIETGDTNSVAGPTVVTIPIQAGHEFGFEVGAFGATGFPSTTYGSRDVTISNFSISSPVDRISLGIFTTSSNTIAVSWPAPSYLWALEVSPEIGAENWQLTAGPTVIGESNFFIFDPTKFGYTNAIFRLIK